MAKINYWIIVGIFGAGAAAIIGLYLYFSKSGGSGGGGGTTTCSPACDSSQTCVNGVCIDNVTPPTSLTIDISPNTTAFNVPTNITITGPKGDTYAVYAITAGYNNVWTIQTGKFGTVAIQMQWAPPSLGPLQISAEFDVYVQDINTQQTQMKALYAVG